MTDTVFESILVTGATGNLGGAVTRALLRSGFKIKAAGTRLDKLSTSLDVVAVRMLYEDPASVDDALQGVDGLFLVAPPMDPDAPRKLKTIIEMAKAAAVRHVVYNSALGVDQDEEAPLRLIERHLMDSGVKYTILRPNFFMENFSTGFTAPMIAQGGIFLAAGEGKTSFISVEDIAEVAARAFQEARYGREYNLTGPQALDHYEVAKFISDASGKNIVYQALSEEAMLDGARKNGAPEGVVQYMAALYRAVRSGWMATVTNDVRDATGRAPISFAEFACRNAIAWK